MFRKGPRPFYKLGDEIGLFAASPPQGEPRGDPAPRAPALDLPDRRLQHRVSFPREKTVTLSVVKLTSTSCHCKQRISMHYSIPACG